MAALAGVGTTKPDGDGDDEYARRWDSLRRCVEQLVASGRREWGECWSQLTLPQMLAELRLHHLDRLEQARTQLATQAVGAGASQGKQGHQAFKQFSRDLEGQARRLRNAE